MLYSKAITFTLSSTRSFDFVAKCGNIATKGNIMDGIINFINEWYQPILAVVGAFAAIATMTPNKADNKIANLLLKVINLFGANFGKAKNDTAKSVVAPGPTKGGGG